MHLPGLFMAARVLVGCMFLYSGGMKVVQFAGTLQMMRGYGFPLATPALIGAIVLEVTCAALMIAGVYLLQAGLALAFFVLLSTAMIHVRDAFKPERRPMAMVHIGNNLTLVGGLLAIAAY